jgi:hypothetical protein
MAIDEIKVAPLALDGEEETATPAPQEETPAEEPKTEETGV